MKKTILLVFMALLSLTVMAQKKDSTKAVSTVAKSSDTLTINKDVKFIKIGEKLISVEMLGEVGKMPLMVEPSWIINLYELLEQTPTGLSKKQIDLLIRPLSPLYYSYLQSIQQGQPKQ